MSRDIDVKRYVKRKSCQGKEGVRWGKEKKDIKRKSSQERGLKKV